MEWIVTAEESGMKLVAFISKKLDTLSARQLKHSIDAGRCRINDRTERFASHIVGRGDKIIFDGVVGKKTLSSTFLVVPERFLYVNEAFIAYDKPSGIASEDDRLLQAVQQQYPGAILLHRLDRDTSGVLLFALNPAIAKAILKLFKQRQIDKTYLAVIDGVPKTLSGTVDNFLGKLHVYHGQTLWGAVPRDKGAIARTHWRVTHHGRTAAIVECHPETGRTHQIRIHLSDLGHPILGDSQYGRIFRCAYRPSRVLLHASEISFVHPNSGQRVVVRSPLPQDFQEAIISVIGKEWKKF